MLGSEILELRTTASSKVGSLQGVTACEIETKRDMKKAQKIIAVSGSCKKTLTERVLSLKEEMSSMRFERGNFCADIDETTTLVQLMKKNVGNCFLTSLERCRNRTTIWLMLLNRNPKTSRQRLG